MAKRIISFICALTLTFSLLNFGTVVNGQAINNNEEKTVPIDKDTDSEVENEKEIKEPDAEIEEIVVENKAEVYATATTTYDVVLKATESYEIINNSGAKYTISSTYSNTSKYNYIIYNYITGDVTKTEVDDSGSAIIPANSRARFQLEAGTVTIKVPEELESNSKFIVNPAYYKITLKYGESYEFVNSSSITTCLDSRLILSSTVKYNLIMYNNLGQIKNMYKDEYDLIKVSPKDKFKISISMGEAFTLYIPYECKDFIKKVDTPVFQALTVKSGENYEFTVGATEKLQALTNSTIFNDLRYSMIVYNGLGNITLQEYNSVGDLVLEKNTKARITSVPGKSTTFYIPYEYKDSYKKVDMPAFEVLKVSDGENYEFTGNDNKITMTTNATIFNNFKYDMIMYNSEGNIISQQYSINESLVLEKNTKARISSASLEGITVYIPYEYKDCYKKVDIPAFNIVTLKKGENLQIAGAVNKQLTVATSANDSASSGSRIGVVKYDALGNVIYQNYNCYYNSGNIKLYSGEKIYISVFNGAASTFRIPYEFKDNCKKVTQPAFEVVTLTKDENVEFNGDLNKTITIETNSDVTHTLNAIEYDSSGNIYNQLYNYSQSIVLKNNIKIRASICEGDSMNLYIPYVFKNCYKKIDRTTFQPVTINKGEVYEFTGHDLKEIQINNSSNSNSNYKYSILGYDREGNTVTEGYDTYGTVKINEGGKARISVVQGDSITLYIPYEYKECYKKVDMPVFYSLTVNKGETYEFAGDSKYVMHIRNNCNNINNSRFDILKYDENGNISFEETLYYEKFTSIIPKGKARLSVSQGENATFYIPYEFKNSFKKVETPVFFEVTIKNGESFKITGDKIRSIPILTNSTSSTATFDASSYSNTGQITSMNKDTYGDFVVASGSGYKATLSKGEAMKVYIPYEFKDSYEKLSTPTIYTGNLKTNETYQIINDSEVCILMNIPAVSATYSKYDIIAYDVMGNVTLNPVDKYGNIKIEAKSRIKIGWASGNDINMYIPYEYKDMIKKTIAPVYNKVSILAGQKYTIKNTTGINSVMKNNSSSTSTYDITYFDDKESSSYSNKYGQINLSSGKTAIITAKTSAIEIYIPYEITMITREKEDVNRDGIVSDIDIDLIRKNYNATLDSYNYDKNYDVNNDGIIDIYDIVITSKKKV